MRSSSDSDPVTLRLPRTYDPVRLRADLAHLEDQQGRPAGYPGESHRNWTSLTLLSGTDASNLHRTPYLRTCLEKLDCSLRLVRLMALGPGGIIDWHADPFVGFEHGVVRLHVPILTHPAIELFIQEHRCVWSPGELWYGDFSRPHFGRNPTQVRRVHMVLDVEVDASLVALFPSSSIAHSFKKSPEPVSPECLERFAFDFVLPAGFAPPGDEFPPLEAPISGSVRPYGTDLVLMVADQPMLKLEPTSDTTLEVIGLTPGTSLDCEICHNRVSRASLVSAGGRTRRFLEIVT